MRIVWRVIAGLVGLVLLLVAIGFVLPARFKVQRSLEIAAPADRVYPLIAAPAEWKRWSIWNQRDPAMTIEYGGPPSGAGAKWAWRSASEGNGAMEFTDAVPNERIGYVLSFPEMGMQSRGALALTPAGTGVRVTWTNEGDMGANPINRWFGLFMDKLVGPDFDAGLANLKKLAEGR